MRRACPSLLAVASLLLLPALVLAATFTPTKFTDSADGSCDADCSLREAVIAANALAGADEIVLAVGTYLLTSESGGQNGGDLDVTDVLTIAGVDFEQTVIQQNAPEERVLEITAAAGPVVLRDLAITGGDLTFIPDDGGGIRARSALTLDAVRVFGNTAPKGAGGGVEIAFAELLVRSSRIELNSAGLHGGIVGGGAAATVVDSTIRANSDSGGGGGMAWSGDLEVSGSTFEGNQTSGLDLIVDGGEVAAVTNSTFSDNGVGISYIGGGEMMLRHVTLVQAAGGDALRIEGANATLFESAIDGPCIGSAQVTSLGENVEAGSGCFVAQATDLTNVGSAALLLGALRDNGGLTDTHAILNFTSPLVDQELGGCATPRDQRGLLRSYCDAGAYALPVCFEPGTPIAIPDNDPVGVTVQISDALFAGNDVDVFLDLEHTYVGDLIVTLDGPGGSVDLVNRPGPGALGCSGNDIRTIFDDEALLEQSDCRDVTDLESFQRASYRPLAALSTQDGQTGAWNLTVSDHESADTGVLHRVCLMPTNSLIFGDGWESGDLTSWSASSP